MRSPLIAGVALLVGAVGCARGLPRPPADERGAAPGRPGSGAATDGGAGQRRSGDRARQPAPREAKVQLHSPPTEEETLARLEMVSSQIEARGIRDPLVLEALRRVPRHEFVPPQQRPYAYEDRPLSIGEGQTISQPYIVALMTELAQLKPGDRVLEVGTGSGYQAAVLATLGAEVYSIEIAPTLARSADERLQRLGHRVAVRHGDGYDGWPERGPFQAIVVTAAPPFVPEPLKRQLALGGRLVIPVGVGWQELVVLTRTAQGFALQPVIPVAFVPMTGEAQRRDGGLN